MDQKTGKHFVVGSIVIVVLAVVVSQFASDEPDGLEYVAEREGFADTAGEHVLGDAPLAEYGEDLTGNRVLDTAIAGIVGVLVTLGLGYGVFWLARRVRSHDGEAESGG